MVMAVGPAGTGKSYVLAHAALDMYFAGVIRKIVITRPPEPVGATLGLFKGDLKEKMLNWLAPILSQFTKVLEDSCGGNAQSHLSNLLESVIVLQPLETAKGSSFDDTFVILEEAQDSNLEALRVLSTRIGANSVLALNGDFGQAHLKNTGFQAFVERIQAYDEQISKAELASEWQREKTPVVFFCRDDIVRSGLTRKMVEIFY
jgi:phosphate starvation-inducible PhoH-like protein